ncbi:hypothetical protein Asera_13440 [Actinocatenispora sera]|uniref:Uncharacterized protein n=1 Tax=Actinocatenispora sera TaxID=390989 RepID=A0A810KY27_9ACTN|nr:hypothetical protein Asera_13440 [Actinocatenispora sera]
MRQPDGEQHQQPAQQYDPGPGDALPGRAQQQREPDPEQQREDRKEPLVEQQAGPLRRGTGIVQHPRAGVGDRLHVDDEDPAQGEPAQHVERRDPARRRGRRGRRAFGYGA